MRHCLAGATRSCARGKRVSIASDECKYAMTGGLPQPHQVAPHLFCSIGVVGDVRIGMQAEHIRRLYERQCLDGCQVVNMAAQWWDAAGIMVVVVIKLNAASS